MRNAQGYAHTWDRETGAVLSERDTFTCHHCNKVVHVKPMCPPEDLGGHCCVCDRLICKECNYLRSLGKPCVPFMKRLDMADTCHERGGNANDIERILSGRR